MKRICYIKTGDVCNELLSAYSSKSKVYGGHLYYVYSIIHLPGKITGRLFISNFSSSNSVSIENSTAKTFNLMYEAIVGKIYGAVIFKIKVLDELIKFKPDYIICARGTETFASFLYSLFFASKLIVTIHTDLNIGRKLNKIFERMVLKHCHAIVCHGPYLKKQTQELLGYKKNIIEYNASCDDICTDKIETFNHGSLPSAILDGNSKVITFAGRVEAEKGVFDLYSAFQSCMSRSSEPVLLVYAGKGEAYTHLISLAKSDGVHKQVLLLDELARNEIAILLKKSWVVVTPTRQSCSEGRCMAGMEALALGVPLIAPQFGAFEYLVRDGINGLFYKPDSTIDLADKICLALDPELRIRLVNGAKNSGQIYRKALVTFSDAISQAMEINDAEG